MIAIFAAALGMLAAFLVFGERLLFRWYRSELRSTVVTPSPGEAVISYPLA